MLDIALREQSLQELCAEYRQLHLELKELQEREKLLRSALEGYGEFMEFGVCLKRVTRRGGIDYQSIPAVARMTDSHLDQFRKADTDYFKLSVY